MTTIEKLIDYHLTCIICSDEFTNPATLQCDHTFCRSCLLKYTKTQPEAIQAKSIPCPVCRRMTEVSSPESPVHEWMNQVKPSKTILKLMDIFGPDTQDGCTCSVCQYERERTPATLWCADCQAAFCDSCLRYHQRMPLSRHHLAQAVSGESKTKVIRNLKCTKHGNEQIHHFCSDCVTALCTICLSMYHNHCQNVLVIQDTIPEDITKAEGVREKEHIGRGESQTDSFSKKVRPKISTTADILEKELSGGKSQTESFSMETAKVEHEIKTACRNAIDVILEREKELITEVNDIRNDQSKALDVMIDEEETAVGNLQQKLAAVSQALESGYEEDMLNAYVLYDLASQEDVRRREGWKPRIPRFRSALESLKTAFAEVTVSEITTTSLKEHSALQDTVDMSHKDDKDDPYLTGVSVLNPDGVQRIIVVDWNNKSIKSVYKDNHQPHLTILKFPASPFGVSRVDPYHVVVTVPSARKIWKVSVCPRLLLSSNIATKQMYYGIAYLSDNKLVACADSKTSFFRQSSSVDVLNMSGIVLHSFKSRALQSPLHVWVPPGGNILVSDAKSQSLVSLSPKGKVVFTYKPKKPSALASPRGVAAGSNGSIVLVDGNSHKVIRLSSTGQYVEDVLTSADGVDRPCSICVDRDLIHVTSGQYVLVFRFL